MYNLGNMITIVNVYGKAWLMFTDVIFIIDFIINLCIYYL